jgi:predicted DNA-binding transcriptional regulator AlpA
VDDLEADRLLDQGEAARFLGLSKATLARWRCLGGGPPFVKLGGRVLYARQRLKEFVQLHERFSTNDPGPEAARTP